MSEAYGGNTTLKSVVFRLDGSPSRRKMQTNRPFCSRQHPGYPWAEMACHLIPMDVFPTCRSDGSVRAPGLDSSAREREPMLKNRASVASDGFRTYRSQNDLYLQRPNGYFAQWRDMPLCPGAGQYAQLRHVNDIKRIAALEDATSSQILTGARDLLITFRLFGGISR